MFGLICLSNFTFGVVSGDHMDGRRVGVAGSMGCIVLVLCT